jgi:hypothetical protein
MQIQVGHNACDLAGAQYLWFWAGMLRPYTLSNLLHFGFEVFQHINGRGVNTVSHRKIIRHIIPEQNQCPHMSEQGIAARIEKIGIDAFDHEGLFG